MGFEQPVMSGAVKTSGFFVSPLGRINLIVTAVVFLILAVVGVSQSFEQHSGYPLFEKTLLPIIGADTSIGIMVDELNANPTPTFDTYMSKSFPAYLWFWLKFWFVAMCNLWFIYFFIWLLYGCWSLTDNSLVLRNIFLAIGSFILISLFIGMVMYNVRLSGSCLPDDRAKNFNHLIANTYPLSGVSKLTVRFVNQDLFNRIEGWSNSGFGKAVTSIPDSPNILNDTLNVSET